MTSVDRFIGLMIRKGREHLALTVEDVAEELGISPDDLRDFERGNSRPAPVQLLSLCSILRVQPSWFFPEYLVADRAGIEDAVKNAKEPGDSRSDYDLEKSGGRIKIVLTNGITVFIGKDFDEFAFRKVISYLRT